MFLGGAVTGIINSSDPANAANLASKFGSSASAPSFFIIVCVSAILTKLGMLPGTKKN